MAFQQYVFDFDTFNSEVDLSEPDQQLLRQARLHTAQAYAPYSRFMVAAVARMAGGQIAFGTNQENASYPVGICAERVLLSTLSSIHHKEPIEAIAIAYHNLQGDSSQPASPCGLCRQSLVEYEDRMGQPIRLILSGMQGKVVVIQTAKHLLPFSFSALDMQ